MSSSEPSADVMPAFPQGVVERVWCKYTSPFPARCTRRRGVSFRHFAPLCPHSLFVFYRHSHSRELRQTACSSAIFPFLVCGRCSFLPSRVSSVFFVLLVSSSSFYRTQRVPSSPLCFSDVVGPLSGLSASSYVSVRLPRVLFFFFLRVFICLSWE